jgi:multicomponent Na+:H+ antiporter subunit D
MQLLLFAVLAFVWMEKTGLHPHEIHGVNLDIEWLYRKLLPATARGTYGASKLIGRNVKRSTKASIKGAAKAMSSTRTAQFHLATSWPTGSMVFWIAVILGLFLIADVFH